jgi:hypothetical protein
MDKPMSESEGSKSSGAPDRLVKRANRERWPIPRELRRPLAARLGAFVQDITASRGESVSAARGLMSASKQNLDTIPAAVKALHVEELDRRMTELEQDVEAYKRNERR